MAELKPETLWAGHHLAVLLRGDWEYVTRSTCRPAVAIVALTGDDKVLLVEQHRPAINRKVIEIPAGLAGDIAGAEHEPLLDAAKRELFEETGYQATLWSELATGYSSPGLTDETIALFLAEGLIKTGGGGGDKREAITIHRVPVNGAQEWLAAKSYTADLKVLAGLYLAQKYIAERSERR